MEIEVYKKTQDDWCGNYKVVGDSRVKDLVAVSFITLIVPATNPPMWRVCVWGNDDFGLERDYHDQNQALSVFHQIIGWEYVNIGRLVEEFRFYSA